MTFVWEHGCVVTREVARGGAFIWLQFSGGRKDKNNGALAPTGCMGTGHPAAAVGTGTLRHLPGHGAIHAGSGNHVFFGGAKWHPADGENDLLVEIGLAKALMHRISSHAGSALRKKSRSPSPHRRTYSPRETPQPGNQDEHGRTSRQTRPHTLRHGLRNFYPMAAPTLWHRTLQTQNANCFGEAGARRVHRWEGGFKFCAGRGA